MLDNIRSDMIVAMKSKDKLKLETIRQIIKETKELEIAKKSPLDENEQIKVIEKLIKQCNESIADFTKANRIELIDLEQQRISILNHYLPKAPDHKEVMQIVTKVLADNPNIKEVGKAMELLKTSLPARSNLKLVVKYLKEQLL